MKHLILLGVLLITVPSAVQAWPFGKSREEKRAEEVTTLLREPMRLMTQASTAEAEGKTEEALSLYAQVLEKIAEIEAKHDTSGPDFATLRVAKGNCMNMIDSIRLANVSADPERVTTVTSTQELEQALARERAEARRGEGAADDSLVVSNLVSVADGGVPIPLIPETESVAVAETPAAVSENPAEKTEATLEDDINWAMTLWEDELYEDLDTFLLEALGRHPGSTDFVLILARLRLFQGRYDDAVMLGELQFPSPKQTAQGLLIAAGGNVGLGKYLPAITALEKVIKLYPRNPEAYINMAWAISEMSAKAAPDAIMYYTRGIELGGMRNAILEHRFNMGDEE